MPPSSAGRAAVARPPRPAAAGCAASGRGRGRATQGPSFNRLIPNILTMLGLCAGLTAIRVAIDGAMGEGGGADRRRRGDRRAGRPPRAAAEGDQPVRRGIRQPVGFPLFRRGAGVGAVSVVAAWRRGIGYAPCLLFAVCSALRLARFNASSRTRGPRAGPRRSRPMPRISSPACRRRPGPGSRCSRCSPRWTFDEWDLTGLAAVARHPGVLRRAAGGGRRR